MLKDVLAKQMLDGDGDDAAPAAKPTTTGVTYVEEQAALKRAFLDSAMEE